MTQKENTPDKLLKKYYGYDTFRPLQAEIIQAVLEGRDALVLMPTGGGKSVCFQIPALAKEGTAIVISPLLALMKDQVDALVTNGIAAAALNSMQTENRNQQIKEDALAGKLKLLYISPERLIMEADHFLPELNVSLFAVDEAHCISHWGHDFRPEYSKLSFIKRAFPGTPLMALTATADRLTREDIIRQLELSNPGIFISSFDRPNLSLNVVPGLNRQRKLYAMIDFIEKHPRQSGIVYCMSRNNTEVVATALNAAGIPATVYHAGLPAPEREKAQLDFLNDNVQVVCATIAFGMGIDKSNVRWIIHYNLPKSIECYYQEIGRAGRDGMPGDTLLFYSLGDLVMLSKFAGESGQEEINREKLRRMQQYAESYVCRRRILLSYFGETVDKDCGNCDVCKNPPQRFDGTLYVQKALSAIVRTGERVTMNLLIDILRGSHRMEIVDKGYDRIKTFGAGADLSFHQWQGYLLQMLQLGYFELLYNEGSILKVTSLGWRVLKGELPSMLTFVDREPVRTKSEKQGAGRKTLPETGMSEDDRLFEALRQFRAQLAKKENVPAYIIFPDRVLQELVTHKPVTLFDFARISGVGEIKTAKYGKAFVELLRRELHVKKGKGETATETLLMLNRNMGIEEIARERNIQSTTVCSHIAQLITEHKFLDWHRFVPAAEMERIVNAWHKTGKPTELKPVYDELEGSIEYGKIRIALAVLALEE